jgi:hypothetical protein
MSKDTAMHHWLVAGSVVFNRKNSDAIETINLNTIVTNKNRTVTVKNIGQSQQGLQIRLFERIGPEATVHDVFIISVSYLGHMTSEAFTAGAGETQNG